MADTLVPRVVDDLRCCRDRLVAGLYGFFGSRASTTRCPGCLRWCYASQDPQRLDQGLQRLSLALG